jgi:hypothetical protein
MNLLKKALTTLGGILLAALLLAALAPRAARGVAAALVQVTNTTANPVPTIDSTAAFPFATTFETGFSFEGSFIVPSTTSTGASVRRLVIESVGVQCTISPGVQNFVATLGVPNPDTTQGGIAQMQFYDFPLMLGAPTTTGTTFMNAPSALHLYVNSGATVFGGVGGSFPVGGDAFCFFNVGGHLETQ